MPSKKILTVTMALSVCLCPLAAMAGHGGGGGGGGSHGGGGGGGGSHGGGGGGSHGGGGGGSHGGGAAPRVESRAQAPHVESHSGGGGSSHSGGAPHVEAARSEAPRTQAMGGSHTGGGLSERPAAGQRASAPHTEVRDSGRGATSSARVEGNRGGSGQREAATGEQARSSSGESSHNMMSMSPGAAGHVNAVRPTNAAQEYKQAAPAQRDAMMSHMGSEQRAQTMSHMGSEEKAEAMYKMSPSERAQTLKDMNPQQRSAFMAPGSAGRTNALRVGAAAVGAAGVIGAAHMMNRRNENSGAQSERNGLERQGAGAERAGEREGNTTERGNGFENGRGAGAESGRGSGGENGRGAGESGRGNTGAERGGRAVIPNREAFTNPRSVNARGVGRFSSNQGGALHYSEGARVPREGDLRSGRAGAIDPGGYLRGAGAGAHYISPEYARSQFAAGLPNYGAVAAANWQNAVMNRGNWPWQLPPYAPGWFNGNPGYYWWQNGSDGWPYGPSWSNGWGGSLPWWMMVANALPWGCNSDLGWVPYQTYYNGYNWNGQNYPMNYFAANGYCPTPYMFNVSSGQFWCPGQGYTDSLPESYHAPITVAVQESVPQYNFQGQAVGYKVQTFHYNAYWNEQNQAYGYYDYRQQYHWVTFPWLHSWVGTQ